MNVKFPCSYNNYVKPHCEVYVIENVSWIAKALCKYSTYEEKNGSPGSLSRLDKINSWQVLMLLLVEEPPLNHSNAKEKWG